MNKLAAEKCRKQFEAWASNDGTFPRAIEKRDGQYILLATQSQWQAWQASREALEQQEKDGWIKHDGDNRPLGLRKHDLVYLNLKKQPIRIPYPAGMVNWKQTGSDFDVLEWKRAEGKLPQADAYSQQEKAAGKHQEGE